MGLVLAFGRMDVLLWTEVTTGYDLSNLEGGNRAILMYQNANDSHSGIHALAFVVGCHCDMQANVDQCQAVMAQSTLLIFTNHSCQFCTLTFST